MAPYELFSSGGMIDYYERRAQSPEHRQNTGMEWLLRFQDHYPHSVWLNPEPENTWLYHPTIQAITKLFKMFPLTIEGVTDSIDKLRKGVTVT